MTCTHLLGAREAARHYECNSSCSYGTRVEAAMALEAGWLSRIGEQRLFSPRFTEPLLPASRSHCRHRSTRSLSWKRSKWCRSMRNWWRWYWRGRHHCSDDHDHREHSDDQYENGEQGQCWLPVFRRDTKSAPLVLVMHTTSDTQHYW